MHLCLKPLPLLLSLSPFPALSFTVVLIVVRCCEVIDVVGANILLKDTRVSTIRKQKKTLKSKGYTTDKPLLGSSFSFIPIVYH